MEAASLITSHLLASFRKITARLSHLGAGVEAGTKYLDRFPSLGPGIHVAKGISEGRYASAFCNYDLERRGSRAEGGHRQLPTDQKGLSRSLLDACSSCPNGTPRRRGRVVGVIAFTPTTKSVKCPWRQLCLSRRHDVRQGELLANRSRTAYCLSITADPPPPPLICFLSDFEGRPPVRVTAARAADRNC